MPRVKAEVKKLLYIQDLFGEIFHSWINKLRFMKKTFLIVISILMTVSVIWAACTPFMDEKLDPADLPLDQIKLPEGFVISVYAEVPNARSMAISPNGTLFVGNRSGDKVYAVVDNDKDGIADKVYIIDEDLKMPNGVAFKDGDLFVAEVSRILRYRDIENHFENPPAPEVVLDVYPTETHHGWKYIAFGPDGLLYVPVGAPCNICDKTDDNLIYTSISRIDINLTNPEPEIIARGIRNTVGFDWDPKTGDLWFTDNGPDRMGNDIPPCELNHLANKGEHVGFPYCHAGTVLDPEFGEAKDCDDYSAPAWNFGAHVAPLGMTFYKGAMFPSEYDNAIIVAQHGSWNRDEKSGYQVMLLQHDDTKASSVVTFAEGWLNKETQKAWGRPVDVLNMEDGAILVSDDYAGVIYRIAYE